MGKGILGVWIGMWIGFSALNAGITWLAPAAEVAEAARLQIADNEPKRQDEFLYAEVVAKQGTCKMSLVDGVEFYYCPDKYLITKTNWTRNSGERKGVVTRYYNETGKLILIYGHPDDV